jgi:heptose I phosphotransferase
VPSTAYERWDDGRVLIAAEFADLFRRHGLTTFAALSSHEGTVAKNLLHERTTTRFELADSGGVRAFYAKRHSPPPWKEYLKPLVRLRRPIVGARNEWEAIHHFQATGIPTMTPVAFGKDGGHSLLVTAAVEGCVKLSELLTRDERTGDVGATTDLVADTARRMHAAGLHHQDFYLGHLLVPTDAPLSKLYVIDLGRVRKARTLSRHWVVKDLAQLEYSAREVPTWDRERLLRGYCGRALTADDRALARRVERKVAAIARHSHKNRL